MVLNFHGLLHLRNFFRRLQYEQAHGVFLAFCLLPGIGRAGITDCTPRLSGVVVDQHLPPEVWTCMHTYSLIIAA